MMKQRSILFFVLLTGTAFAPCISAAETPLMLTLEQALQLAKEKSVDLTLAHLTLDDFHSRYRQAIGGALPEIGLTATYSRNIQKPVAFFSGGKMEAGRDNGFDAAITAEQPLYSGGKVLTTIRGARHGLHGQEKLLESTQDDVALAVKSLFYGALLSSATVAIERDNLSSAQEHLDTIRARFRQGLDSDLTLRRQDVEVANTSANLIRAKNLHEMALINLQELLTLDVDRPLQVLGVLAPPNKPAPPYETVSKMALQRHPGLQAAREQTQVSDHLISIALANMKPKLSLFGSLEWVAQANDLSPTADERATVLIGGLKLSYPLFAGGSQWESVRQARVAYQRDKEQEDRLERAVRVDVRRQWLAITEALERAKSQEEAVEEARLALKATEIRYRAGQANQLELNDATFALNRVRTLYIQAAHDYQVSLASLERAAGGSLQGVQP
ncbi:MAG: TolC family protein [Elusimicrobiota bacterium]|jgi:outer membrane protein TolC